MDTDETVTDECTELARRLTESEKTYKLFGFSHIILVGSVAHLMDTSLRVNMDGMYRKTRPHCKTDREAELYRQRLCNLYLTYLERGLTFVDRLEPRVADVLAVEVESPAVSVGDRLAELRARVAERTKRTQSLVALQNRLKTDTVMAEWVISKVEPKVFEAENDLARIECISPDDVTSILSTLNRMKHSFQSLRLGQ